MKHSEELRALYRAMLKKGHGAHGSVCSVLKDAAAELDIVQSRSEEALSRLKLPRAELDSKLTELHHLKMKHAVPRSPTKTLKLASWYVKWQRHMNEVSKVESPTKHGSSLSLSSERCDPFE